MADVCFPPNDCSLKRVSVRFSTLESQHVRSIQWFKVINESQMHHITSRLYITPNHCRNFRAIAVVTNRLQSSQHSSYRSCDSFNELSSKSGRSLYEVPEFVSNLTGFQVISFVDGDRNKSRDHIAPSSKRDDRFMRALADGQWLQSLSRVFVSAIHRNASRSDRVVCMYDRACLDDSTMTLANVSAPKASHFPTWVTNRYFPTKFECVLMSRNVGPYRTWVTSRTVQF